MTLTAVVVWALLTCVLDSLGQVVLSQSGDQMVQPGQTVTIHCKHEPAINCVKKDTSKYCMSWYHQIPGEVPKLLIYYTDQRASGIPSKFSGSESGNKIDFTLTISGVEAEDSGDYYCQSQHKGTSTNNVWVWTFGGGMRLSVGTNTQPSLTVLPPSSAELQQGKATLVCLANKGFPSDWKLSWKVDSIGWSEGVSVSPAVLQTDGLYSWSSTLTLPESKWRWTAAVTCEVTRDSQTPVTKSINTQACTEE
uniref:Ig-like domain-containing protein n=1 Tax=Electrophorus electricus TaxID=8005 RepID=A0AAY5F4R7_ELEEL